jgi:hypothetical protein
MAPAPVELQDEPRGTIGRQLAVGLLPYGNQDDTRTLEITNLDPSDKWAPIYAACLGLLPLDIPETTLRDLEYIPNLRLMTLSTLTECL